MQSTLMRHIVLLLLVLPFLPGCSSSAGQLASSRRFLWPPPPEKSVYEFIGTYSSVRDLPRLSPPNILENVIDAEKEEFKLGRPFGVAANSQGRILISDLAENKIKEFDFSDRTASYFSSKTELKFPLGMAVDASGNIYIADGEQHKVLVFSGQGEYRYSIGGEKTIDRPAYIAVNDQQKRIYVSDGNKHRICVYDLDGNHLFSFGKKGEGKGELAAPQGLAFDRQNRLYVADMLNARIQVFDLDGSFLFLFGSRCAENWCMETPKDIAVSSDGNLHIIDSRKAQLQTYSPKGEYLLTTGGSTRTTHPMGFSLPTAIQIDNSDRIFIVDQLNRRVSVWQYQSEAYQAKLTSKTFQEIKTP